MSTDLSRGLPLLIQFLKLTSKLIQPLYLRCPLFLLVAQDDINCVHCQSKSIFIQCCLYVRFQICKNPAFSTSKYIKLTFGEMYVRTQHSPSWKGPLSRQVEPHTIYPRFPPPLPRALLSPTHFTNHSQCLWTTSHQTQNKLLFIDVINTGTLKTTY